MAGSHGRKTPPGAQASRFGLFPRWNSVHAAKLVAADNVEVRACTTSCPQIRHAL